MITSQIVLRHAERLTSTLDGATRELLATDTFGAITGPLGINLHQRAPSAIPSGCSVDGFYDELSDTIVIAESISVRRRNFSASHELGHRMLLQDVSDTLRDLLWKHPAGDDWREVICNAIAAELLLPSELVDVHIDPAGPTAEAVVSLFAASQASREVCAVRAAQKLGSTGYVVVAELDGTVRFAATSQTPYPIARGTTQGEVHPLAAAGRHGTSRQSDVTLAYRTGTRTDRLHADCLRDGDYVFGVFTTGRPAWPLAFTALTPSTREIPEYFCERCQEPYTSFADRCKVCREQRPCPTCGWCSCRTPDPQALERCQGRRCGLSFPPEQLEKGYCRDCR